MTIAMMVVPKSEIHQFGAGIIDKRDRIIEWEEKPKEPKTNLASMGIYVFDYKYLLDTLEKDKAEIDFGMHILQRAIENDNVYAYPFYGYWRDVGTIQTYWEANMDVIKKDSGISPQEWNIRTNIESGSRLADRPPARFGFHTRVQSSLISAGSNIQGEVINSVLAPGVTVEEGAIVRDSILFADCTVEKDAVVDYSILDKRAHIGVGAVVGSGTNHTVVNRLNPSHLYTGITLIGKGSRIPAEHKIGRNCVINSLVDEEAYPGKSIEDGETLSIPGEKP